MSIMRTWLRLLILLLRSSLCLNVAYLSSFGSGTVACCHVLDFFTKSPFLICDELGHHCSLPVTETSLRLGHHRCQCQLHWPQYSCQSYSEQRLLLRTRPTQLSSARRAATLSPRLSAPMQPRLHSSTASMRLMLRHCCSHQADEPMLGSSH